MAGKPTICWKEKSRYIYGRFVVGFTYIFIGSKRAKSAICQRANKLRTKGLCLRRSLCWPCRYCTCSTFFRIEQAISRVMKRTTFLASVFVGMLCAFGASAMTISYQTASGATEIGGNQVSAQAIFTTGANTLNITLNNLVVNPKTVAQNISDLYFTLDGGSTSGISINSSGGNLVQVNSDGTTTSKGAASSTGWDFSYDASSGGFHLNGLGATYSPAYTILGAPGSGGTYNNANDSITEHKNGSSPHNPFLDQSAVFSLSIPGLTADTTVTSATFSFGTGSDNDVPGTPVPDGGTTLLLLGAALTGLGVIKRRCRKE